MSIIDKICCQGLTHIKKKTESKSGPKVGNHDIMWRIKYPKILSEDSPNTCFRVGFFLLFGFPKKRNPFVILKYQLWRSSLKQCIGVCIGDHRIRIKTMEMS